MNSAVGRNYDKNHHVNKPIKRLRWDRGDLVSYYSYTGYLLSSIFYEFLNIQKDSFNGCNQVLVDDIYDRIVTALNVSAHSYIPSCSPLTLTIYGKPRVDLELARYMINATKPDAPIDLVCVNFVKPLQSPIEITYTKPCHISIVKPSGNVGTLSSSVCLKRFKL